MAHHNVHTINEFSKPSTTTTSTTANTSSSSNTPFALLTAQGMPSSSTVVAYLKSLSLPQLKMVHYSVEELLNLVTGVENKKELFNWVSATEETDKATQQFEDDAKKMQIAKGAKQVENKKCLYIFAKDSIKNGEKRPKGTYCPNAVLKLANGYSYYCKAHLDDKFANCYEDEIVSASIDPNHAQTKRKRIHEDDMEEEIDPLN